MSWHFSRALVAASLGETPRMANRLRRRMGPLCTGRSGRQTKRRMPRPLPDLG